MSLCQSYLSRMDAIQNQVPVTASMISGQTDKMLSQDVVKSDYHFHRQMWPLLQKQTSKQER